MNQENEIQAIIEKLRKGFVSYGTINEINATIPSGLFYRPENRKNGGEHYLEGKEITIEFFGSDEQGRDYRHLTIIINEEREAVNFLSEELNDTEEDRHLHPMTIKLCYQLARKVLIGLIYKLGPSSLNLKTI